MSSSKPPLKSPGMIRSRADPSFTMSRPRCAPPCRKDGAGISSRLSMILAEAKLSRGGSPPSLKLPPTPCGLRRTPRGGIRLRRVRPGQSCEARRAKQDGGARRVRTDDLMLAKHALYQLSYGPHYAPAALRGAGPPLERGEGGAKRSPAKRPNAAKRDGRPGQI